jgi:lipopolysaccharide transport system permease protein
VKYRDVTVGVPLAVQVWLFVSPVAYSGSLVEGGWRYVYALNPLFPVIDGIRWAFLGADAPDAAVVGIAAGAALAILAAAIVYFRRTERFFADII